MKSALAAMAEAARVLHEADMPFAGEVLLTSHGLHEATLGTGQTVKVLCEKGYVGNAVIVTEVGKDAIPVCGKGMAVWEVTLKRPGEVLHELRADESVANPLYVAHELVAQLRELTAEFAKADHPPYVGPDTYFVGEIRSGDFYNRVPTQAYVQGTRRWSVKRTFKDVEQELQLEVEALRRGRDLEAEIKWTFVGDPFEVGEQEPIIQATAKAYDLVVGQRPPFDGLKAIADGTRYWNWANHVPVSHIGVDQATAHGSLEKVPIADIPRLAKLLIAASGYYLG